MKHPAPATIAGVLAAAAARLGDEDGRLEAEVLLAHCLGRPRSHLLAWPDKVLDAAARERFEGLVARRLAGAPVAHLTGVREFWSLALTVTPDILIPRPDTETLVERALAHIPPGRPLTVADLGTGSGAVALALASERPACTVVATDRSAAALAVAARNRATLGLANVHLAAADWCAPFAAGACDVMVSNPPYVAAADPHLEQGDVRFEPRGALTAGADGLDAIRRIVAGAPRCLAGGWLLLEHGFDQGPAVRALLTGAGFRQVRTHPDLAGRERVSEGRWPGTGAA